MARRSRSEMIAQTRTKLLTAARAAFGTVGYADTAMDELTAAAGLTRGALYHHFGDKRGLLEAVVAEIDAEMTTRLTAVCTEAGGGWPGFVAECRAYLAMALEPEIQRIMLRDAPAVLGAPSSPTAQEQCIRYLTQALERLMADGVIRRADPEGLAHLLNGASFDAARWIANAEDAEATLGRALQSWDVLLDGLRIDPGG